MTKLLMDRLKSKNESIINGPIWIDENFEKKVKGLSAEEGFYKPQGLNSVAQILDHLTQWKRSFIEYYSGNLEAQRPENNGFRNNKVLQGLGWEKIKESFHETHDELTRLLDSKDDGFLTDKFIDTGYPNEFFIDGLLDHDIYHLGQIGIILRLLDMGK